MYDNGTRDKTSGNIRTQLWLLRREEWGRKGGQFDKERESESGPAGSATTAPILALGLRGSLSDGLHSSHLRYTG